MIVGVHCNAGCPDIADTVHLTRVVNDTEVGPVLHILGTESIQGLDIVTIRIVCGRIIGVGNHVEIRVVGSGTWVSQVVITRNRVVGQAKCGKTRNHACSRFQTRKFPNFSVIHEGSFEGINTT